MEEMKRVERLEARLGYAFADRRLALVALTHKSWVNEHRDEGEEDNERLEFLGDAVVDLAVSQRLMAVLPEAREGQLSKLRASLVSKEALSQVGDTLELGALLRLGRGEERTGGRQKASLVANALEAIIAVVFLSDGLPAVLDLVDRHVFRGWDAEAPFERLRDHKTRLQEESQAREGVSPRYRVVEERGPDHDKVFEVEVLLGGQVAGRGAGRSKKEAEQEAAREALARWEAGVED